MLCMPLDAQRGVRGAIRQASDLTAQRRQAHHAAPHDGQSHSTTLEAYVCGRDNTDDVVCRATMGAPDERGVSELRVTCRHAPPPRRWGDWAAARPHGVREVGYTSGGVPYAAVGNAAGEFEVYLPGRARPKGRHFTLARARSLAMRDGVGAARDAAWEREWDRVAAQYIAARARRVAEYTRTLRVATDTALELWDQSTGQVLKCLPPVTATRFTCLVVR